MSDFKMNFHPLFKISKTLPGFALLAASAAFAGGGSIDGGGGSDLVATYVRQAFIVSQRIRRDRPDIASDFYELLKSGHVDLKVVSELINPLTLKPIRDPDLYAWGYAGDTGKGISPSIQLLCADEHCFWKEAFAKAQSQSVDQHVAHEMFRALGQKYNDDKYVLSIGLLRLDKLEKSDPDRISYESLLEELTHEKYYFFNKNTGLFANEYENQGYYTFEIRTGHLFALFFNGNGEPVKGFMGENDCGVASEIKIGTNLACENFVSLQNKANPDYSGRDNHVKITFAQDGNESVYANILWPSQADAQGAFPFYPASTRLIVERRWKEIHFVQDFEPRASNEFISALAGFMAASVVDIDDLRGGYRSGNCLMPNDNRYHDSGLLVLGDKFLVDYSSMDAATAAAQTAMDPVALELMKEVAKEVEVVHEPVGNIKNPAIAYFNSTQERREVRKTANGMFLMAVTSGSSAGKPIEICTYQLKPSFTVE